MKFRISTSILFREETSMNYKEICRKPFSRVKLRLSLPYELPLNCYMVIGGLTKTILMFGGSSRRRPILGSTKQNDTSKFHHQRTSDFGLIKLLPGMYISVRPGTEYKVELYGGPVYFTLLLCLHSANRVIESFGVFVRMMPCLPM